MSGLAQKKNYRSAARSKAHFVTHSLPRLLGASLEREDDQLPCVAQQSRVHQTNSLRDFMYGGNRPHVSWRAGSRRQWVIQGSVRGEGRFYFFSWRQASSETDLVRRSSARLVPGDRGQNIHTECGASQAAPFDRSVIINRSAPYRPWQPWPDNDTAATATFLYTANPGSVSSNRPPSKTAALTAPTQIAPRQNKITSLGPTSYRHAWGYVNKGGVERFASQIHQRPTSTTEKL